HGTSSDIAIFLPSRPPPLKTVPLAILSPALLKLLRLPPTTAAGSFDAQRFPGLNAESRLRQPSLSFYGAIAASPARSAAKHDTLASTPDIRARTLRSACSSCWSCAYAS